MTYHTHINPYWSWYDDTPFQTIAQLDVADVYAFDMVLVFKDTRDGKVYAGHDSGCSCPTPFESHTFPTDYVEVRAWGDLAGLLDNFYEWRQPTQSQLLDLRNALEAAL